MHHIQLKPMCSYRCKRAEFAKRVCAVIVTEIPTWHEPPDTESGQKRKAQNMAPNAVLPICRSWTLPAVNLNRCKSAGNVA